MKRPETREELFDNLLVSIKEMGADDYQTAMDLAKEIYRRGHVKLITRAEAVGTDGPVTDTEPDFDDLRGHRFFKQAQYLCDTNRYRWTLEAAAD